MGNIVMGLLGTINLSYYIHLTSGGSVDPATNATTTTTLVITYIMDMLTGDSAGQVDITVLMPTAATSSYTKVTTHFLSSSTPLVALHSYWLPFCFTTTTTTTCSLVTCKESAIIITRVSGSGGKTTVGSCKGRPSCKPEVQSSTLATRITHSTAMRSGSIDSSDSTITITTGVAVPVVLAVVGLVACAVAYITYTQSKG
jgi:hypothetical protein